MVLREIVSIRKVLGGDAVRCSGMGDGGAGWAGGKGRAPESCEIDRLVDGHGRLQC